MFNDRYLLNYTTCVGSVFLVGQQWDMPKITPYFVAPRAETFIVCVNTLHISSLARLV